MVVWVVLSACGDAKIKGQEIPAIEVRVGQQAIADGATVYARPELPAVVEVGNVGTGVLEIRDISIESVPAGAFALASTPRPTEADPIRIAPGELAHAFSVALTPEAVADGARPVATVRIRTNLTIAGKSEFRFDVEPEVRVSRLVVAPPILDFATVESGQGVTRTANLLNTGAVAVSVTSLSFSGHAGYTATFGGVDYTASAGVVTLAAPVVIAPGSAHKVDVRFVSEGDEPAQARMTFFSDDADANGIQLKLYANLVGPCLTAKPPRVSFGGKLVGQMSEVMFELQSCGDVEVVIDKLDLVDDGGGVFAVEAARVGTFPLTIESGASVLVPLTYFPETVARVVDGQFALDRGLLLVRSDAYLGDLEVPIEGFGTDGTCPVAHIAVAEGEQVLPQTVLHLDASGSSAAFGSIVGYEWSVVQPSGSVSVFAPSATVVNPTFETNIVGDYIFRLSVTDGAGVVSCSPAELTVTVVPEDAIHVELLWRTPGDADESDSGGDQVSFSAGSDVDLHFLHPRSFGIYFSPDYDCYWDNIRPEWGGPGGADDPRLDRDDTDGGGPENLNVEAPESGIRYQVGVHYWNDWGYGDVFATVNVYIFGRLRERWHDVALTYDDMWDAYTIDWPEGTVTRIGSGPPQIRPEYRQIGPGQ